MKDFLSNLADQEEIKKNPFKVFALGTAMKFEDVDERQADMNERVGENEKAILKMVDSKLDVKTFNDHIRDYDTFKSSMKVYVIVGTVVINLAIWVIQYLITK